jgi:hypothetical protein
MPTTAERGLLASCSWFELEWKSKKPFYGELWEQQNKEERKRNGTELNVNSDLLIDKIKIVCGRTRRETRPSNFTRKLKTLRESPIF